MAKYRILWIDDQWENLDAFSEYCKDEYDISLEPYRDAVKGMKAFEGSLGKWDGVLLDAKMLMNGTNEVTSLEGLAYCVGRIKELAHKRAVPYYILTGQPDLMNDRTFKETYGEYFQKNNEDDEERLIQTMIRNAGDITEFQIRFRYSDILGVFPDCERRMVAILKYLEEGINDDPEALVKVRKMMERVFEYCYECGILTVEPTKTNLAACSKTLGDTRLSNLIPIYVQRSMYSVVSVTNPIAHTSDMEKDVELSACPYLVRSTIYELLNIITWCKQLPTAERSRDYLSEHVAELLGL